MEMTPAANAELRAVELEALAAQLAAARRQKLAASDAAEAKAATAECEQEVPYNTPSRARVRATQIAKALEVAQLHVSILHQKLEAESKLHGLQSPQQLAAQAAYARADQKMDAIEREADCAAAVPKFTQIEARTVPSLPPKT